MFMLHSQARALLDLMEQSGVPATHTLTPAEARKAYLDRRLVTQPEPPEVASVQGLQAQGPHGPIPLRLYRPITEKAADVLPALIYFHGGGWVIGDLDSHDTLCRQLANGAGCIVVAVDYRLGPEHRFPAAVDDSLAAIRWVRDNAAALGIDKDRIAVGGDSAGGNLAAVAAIDARDAGTPLAFQLLIYPATDMRQASNSYQTNGQGYMLTHDTMAYFRSHYIRPDQYDDWRASPLLHADLTQLPDAFVLTAGFDPLRDDGLLYAERLTAAGNRATYACFERQIHGFILMGRVLDEAHSAVNLCAAELRRALA
jgi:acetyl esterase